MSAETVSLFASLPEDLQADVDYYAQIIRARVKNTSPAPMSLDGAREVVIKLLQYMELHEVKR
jgi:hypothetical protein